MSGQVDWYKLLNDLDINLPEGGSAPEDAPPEEADLSLLLWEAAGKLPPPSPEIMQSVIECISRALAEVAPMMNNPFMLQRIWKIAIDCFRIGIAFEQITRSGGKANV